MDPRNGGDLLCSHEGVYPVARRGRREGGAGYGRCPVQVGRGDPQDPLRVPEGRDDEEEQRGAWALLPENLPPLVGSPAPGQGGGTGSGWPSRGVRASPGGGRGTRWASWGASRTLRRTGGFGLALSYTGLVGQGQVGASSAPSTNTLISPTSRFSSGGCRRWSATSNSDTPRGYLGPRLVQVRGRVPGSAHPEGVQQGWGAAEEGHGRPRARHLQGVPHGQGPA